MPSIILIYMRSKAVRSEVSNDEINDRKIAYQYPGYRNPCNGSLFVHGFTLQAYGFLDLGFRPVKMLLCQGDMLILFHNRSLLLVAYLG